MREEGRRVKSVEEVVGAVAAFTDVEPWPVGVEGLVAFQRELEALVGEERGREVLAVATDVEGNWYGFEVAGGWVGGVVMGERGSGVVVWRWETLGAFVEEMMRGARRNGS